MHTWLMLSKQYRYKATAISNKQSQQCLNNILTKYVIFLVLLTYCKIGVGQAVNIKLTYTINTNIIKARVEPTMYGIFFEDINMAADGGVYAELIKNRSLQFNMPLAGWAEHKKRVQTDV